MKLIMLGIQGSGKGTQSELIAKRFNLKHLSTGDLIRAEISAKTELGLKIKEIIENGRLAPNELTNALMAKHIPKDNYILDGYPRSLEQAEFLEKFNPPDKIIFLELPEKEVFHRLGSRLQCSKCGIIYGLNHKASKGECEKCHGKLIKRKDDNDEAIKIRINVFKKETLPLLKFFKNRVINIDGNHSVDKVFKDIVKVLE